MTQETIKVDYDVVSDIAGHQPNKQVNLVEAAKDIFAKVKEKAMQCAVKGEFIQFDTVADLEHKLTFAVKQGYSIRVFDENIGGETKCHETINITESQKAIRWLNYTRTLFLKPLIIKS